MKKNLNKIAFLVVAAMVMGAFTACGGADSANSEEGTTVATVEETTTEETTEVAEEETEADEEVVDENEEENIEISGYIGDDGNIYTLTPEQMVVTDAENNVLATLTVTSNEGEALVISDDETGEVYSVGEVDESGTVSITNEAGEAVAVLTPMVAVE